MTSSITDLRDKLWVTLHVSYSNGVNNVYVFGVPNRMTYQKAK